MPDYAEVAGCSSFKNSASPTYDTFGAYATTTLVGRQFPKNPNSYSAPNSVHYNNFMAAAAAAAAAANHQQSSNSQLKMNIIENKMESLMNNLNGPSPMMQPKNGTKSVPQTPLLNTMRRNRLVNGNSINSSTNKSNKLSSSPYLNGIDGSSAEQPLFMKSKFDGSWTSIPSTSAMTGSTTTSNNNSPSHLPASYHASPRHHPTSLNQLNGGISSNNNNSSNSIDPSMMTKGNLHSNGSSYLSSFGRSDKV